MTTIISISIICSISIIAVVAIGQSVARIYPTADEDSSMYLSSLYH